MNKSWLRWGLRLAVSLALLGALFAFVPLGELWSAVRAVSPVVWLGGLAAVLLGHLLAATKWWLLLSRQEHVSFRLAVQAHFTGLSANLCLPGIAGGDVVRAAYVMKQGDNRAGLGVASVADRMLDCLALLLLAGAGAFWTANLHGLIGQALLVLSGLLLACGLVAGLVYWRMRSSRHGLAIRIAEALAILARHPWLMLRCLAMSLVIQSSFVAVNALIGSEAGVEASLAGWLVGWPLAKLAALAPFSLGGLGVRESALAVFLKPFGAATAAVVAASLIWRALMVAGGLVGMLALWAPAPRRLSPTSPVAALAETRCTRPQEEASVS
jgi:uncharacterized membrane protein YbhN (UPF0104 family)